jgi:serine/threonine-protein phosphatase 4 regulatory subunit 1
LFSPLLFSSNSPLASPLPSPTYPLRSNPFDQSTVAPFERRTNLCDTYVHDHSVARPSSPISESPILPNSHRALCIDLPESGVAPSPQDARSSPQTPLVTENEWSISQNFQDSAQDLCFDDEGLSPLERIYLFCRSDAAFHR